MPKKINLINQKGDHGTTSLFPDTRTSKSSPRIDAIGDLDELGAVLGLARYHTKTKKIKSAIFEIQNELFIIGSELASPKSTSKNFTTKIYQAFLKNLETRALKLQNQIILKPYFSLPGKVLSASYINLARTVTRRLERKIVKLYEQKIITNQFMLAWINRLSVYLYLMNRFEDKNPDLLK